MSKITCFHGTSADNLKSIRKDGLKPDCNKLWTPSGEAVYFWSVPAINKTEGNEDSLDPSRARQRAIESAQFALAKAKDCRIVLIECELDESEVEPDYSCPNMDGAICINRAIKPSEIKSIEISNDLSMLKGYFMSFAISSPLSNLSLSQFEKKIAQCFLDSVSIFYEEIESLIDMRKVRN